MEAAPRLYGEFAAWWQLLSSPENYAEEAALYRAALLDACQGEARTLLELGSGGGNNASYLKERFEITLVDLSPGMLDVSRGLNPECEHHVGDMRSVRLDRTFDCVFVHDAVCYMTTEADLGRAIATAFLHCRPGGSALFAPDFVRENFKTGTDCGGHDGSDGRGLRYLSWVWDPDPADTTYIVDYAYLLREPDGVVSVEQDRHHEGIFGRDVWLRLLENAGFRARALPVEHTEVDYDVEVLVATRPAADS